MQKISPKLPSQTLFFSRARSYTYTRGSLMRVYIYEIAGTMTKGRFSGARGCAQSSIKYNVHGSLAEARAAISRCCRGIVNKRRVGTSKGVCSSAFIERYLSLLHRYAFKLAR